MYSCSPLPEPLNYIREGRLELEKRFRFSSEGLCLVLPLKKYTIQTLRGKEGLKNEEKTPTNRLNSRFGLTKQAAESSRASDTDAKNLDGTKNIGPIYIYKIFD